MVDYEGKLTPYAQPKEIVCKAVELGLPAGEGFFLTPRLPNPTLEEWERTMLSLEAALLANYYSRRLAGADAVRWVVLPMVEDVDTVRLVRRVLERKATSRSR
jgi:phosphoenolpyruvate carboxylase